eukprot:CAMPEP_0183587544 /NCGR_PEP_ID=MMETSP0371-20130417/159184_1 /TAXON_ID=268820 /ORGANISM="Peridinium aciculiferum, Strain PAER-2" /LENGTH=59 /DNA_ID=CAMNT_0025798731 /DNA_START=12 /DNA_END=188 /DNA_ORIENTATION=+
MALRSMASDGYCRGATHWDYDGSNFLIQEKAVDLLNFCGGMGCYSSVPPLEAAGCNNGT